jgi:hypothetical protein
VKAKEFEKRFGVKLTSKFRHVPDSFARLLAKKERAWSLSDRRDLPSSH